jgi:uncharacterized membrane protein YeaQ/YmgE (transglycosylase-associated protein family)
MPILLRDALWSLVIPALIGVLACRVLARRESMMGMIGIGMLSSVLASYLRAGLHITPVRVLGALEPFLWIVVVSFLLVGTMRLFAGLWRKLIAKPHQD